MTTLLDAVTDLVTAHGADRARASMIAVYLADRCAGLNLSTVHSSSRSPLRRDRYLVTQLGLTPARTVERRLHVHYPRAVHRVLAQLGKPYVYGTAGPGTYDCSGLTMAAWADSGIQLPHNAAAQAQLGTPVAAPFLLRAGDLVFIPGSDGTMQAPGHVGMYIGTGLVIEAPQTGDLVKLVPLSSFGPVAAMRHYG